jgi:hypothetical protein
LHQEEKLVQVSFPSNTSPNALLITTLPHEGKIAPIRFTSSTSTNTLPTTTLHHEGKASADKLSIHNKNKCRANNNIAPWKRKRLLTFHVLKLSTSKTNDYFLFDFVQRYNQRDRQITIQ